MSPWIRLTRPAIILIAALLAFTACTASPTPNPEDGTPDAASTSATSEDDATASTTSAPQESTVFTGDSPASLSLQAVQAFFDTAPMVVIAGQGEELKAASAAVALGVPVLMDGPEVTAELERLGAEVALAIGAIDDPGIDVVVPEDDAALAEMIGASDAPESPTVPGGEQVAALVGLDAQSPQLLTLDDATVSATPSPAASPENLESDRDELPQTRRPEPMTGVIALSAGDDRDTAAVGTALASGAQVAIVPDGDPRSTSESVKASADASPGVAVGFGPEFVDAETLAWRFETAGTGAELPGGGQLVLPGKTYVALYGTPESTALGVLGEQDEEATIKRAAALAAEYEPLTENTVVPALEIIATVASAQAGGDGDYSNELSMDRLRPLVDLAAENGQYVVIDLQPGRTDFLTQAKLYEDLLKLPHVGLALDPEWRLLPNQVHLRQIGHVEVAEVNEVVNWLADLTRENNLPQKMVILHQFQVQMLRDVNDVDQSRSEVAILIHVDGQGPQPTKQTTWRTLHNNATAVKYWGWKNFYDEDIPGPLSPADTMSKVDPVPDFISYQ